MAKYDAQHFTPTSTEDSAYAWDKLADVVIGHEPKTTSTREQAIAAFSGLERDDLRLLLKILANVPNGNVHHLYGAVQTALSTSTTPRAIAWKDEVAIAAQRLQDALTLVPSNVAHYAIEQARPLLAVLAKINRSGD
jgi:hypothetical protein